MVISMLLLMSGRKTEDVLMAWQVDFLKVKESEVTQSYLTLCDHMDYSLPDSSIDVIFQARVLEWVTISLSKYAEYIMWNAGLDEAQPGIKIQEKYQ